jgi:hypothetical protein
MVGAWELLEMDGHDGDLSDVFGRSEFMGGDMGDCRLSKLNKEVV